MTQSQTIISRVYHPLSSIEVSMHGDYHIPKNFRWGTIDKLVCDAFGTAAITYKKAPFDGDANQFAKCWALELEQCIKINRLTLQFQSIDQDNGKRLYGVLSGDPCGDIYLNFIADV